MRALIAFAALAVAAAPLTTCGEATPCTASSALDPDAPALTSGSWYRPAADVTWQWQLTGVINTGYDVEIYDVDLFDTPSATLRSLHGEGRRVLCYFSAGTAEDWRPDYGDFEACALGDAVDGWPGEVWLDIRSQTVVDVMSARLDLAVERGCDGVEPDNVDGYTNDPGFPLSPSDQLAFNKWLANEAHARDLAVALKNDLDQVGDLVGFFDLALNEQCHVYDECDALRPFLSRGKPVLNAEYAISASQAASQASSLCPGANAAGLRSVIFPRDLDDAFREACF